MCGKKTYAVFCFFLMMFFGFFNPVFSQDMEIFFSNELSSDIVNIYDGDSEFAGISDEVILELTSARVDIGLDVVIDFDLNGGPDGDAAQISYNADDFDWFAAFRPADVFEIGFSTDNWLAGSYLVVEDDNVAGSKMGSDGLSVVYSGIPGLKIGATVPFKEFGESNVFEEFVFGFGAEYAVGEILAVGAAVNDILHDMRVVSVSAGFFPAGGVEIYAGYSWQDFSGLCGVWGPHLLNASLAWSGGRFGAGADFLTNFGSEDKDAGESEFDLYAALYGEYRIAEPCLVKLTVSDQSCFGRMEDSVFAVTPGVEFGSGIGDFSLEAEIAFSGSAFEHVCFPVSWTYEF